MDFYQKLLNNYRVGKMTVVQNNKKCYQIFSTLDKDGNLRTSYWCETIDEAMEDIGCDIGYSKKEIEGSLKRFNWKIVKTIDFSELGGTGYKEGEKVRILPNVKEECLKRNVFYYIYEMKKIIEDGYGYFKEYNGNNVIILNKKKDFSCIFPLSAIEPYYEEDKETTENHIKEKIIMDEIKWHKKQVQIQQKIMGGFTAVPSIRWYKGRQKEAKENIKRLEYLLKTL